MPSSPRASCSSRSRSPSRSARSSGQGPEVPARLLARQSGSDHPHRGARGYGGPGIAGCRRHGIWLSQVTGSAVWDAAASALIGLLLVGVAVVLALENYSLLIGEAAPATVEAKIRRLVREDDDVVDVLDLRTMHMGPEDILVAAGVKFRPHLTTTEIRARSSVCRPRSGSAGWRDQRQPHPDQSLRGPAPTRAPGPRSPPF